MDSNKACGWGGGGAKRSRRIRNEGELRQKSKIQYNLLAEKSCVVPHQVQRPVRLVKLSV